MKINKAYNNENLIAALAERDSVIQSMINDGDYDDKQLEIINKYTHLSQFHKDLLYLTTRYKIKEICELYAVSHTHIYNNLKKIRELLK